MEILYRRHVEDTLRKNASKWSSFCVHLPPPRIFTIILALFKVVFEILTVLRSFRHVFLSKVQIITSIMTLTIT